MSLHVHIHDGRRRDAEVTYRKFDNGSWFYLVNGNNYGPYNSQEEAKKAAESSGYFTGPRGGRDAIISRSEAQQYLREFHGGQKGRVNALARQLQLNERETLAWLLREAQ